MKISNAVSRLTSWPHFAMGTLRSSLFNGALILTYPSLGTLSQKNIFLVPVARNKVLLLSAYG